MDHVEPLHQESLIVFSAKTKWSLMRYLGKMRDFLITNSSIGICDVARALQKINHDLEQRAAIIASSCQDLQNKLKILQDTKNTLLSKNIYISSEQKPIPNPITLSLEQSLTKMDLSQLALHWVAGATIEFRKINNGSEAFRVDLPRYAFDHNIEFGFAHKLMQDNELVDINEEYYENILERLSNDELSLEQFEKIIRM